MRRLLLVLVVGLLWAGSAAAQGQLIPTATDVGPLRLTRHEVSVTAEEQVCTTRVVQTFRNDTSRDLEAIYTFPVPKGASVKKFTLWVDGKEVVGEMVEANKAREIYTEIVRRTQDPGLLEYVDCSLLRVRVFPVPARGEQKLAVSFNHVANNDNGVIEYLCSMKSGKNAAAVEHFRFEADLKSQKPLHNIYSPSHTVTINHRNERHATIRYEANNTSSDRDLQLYWSAGKDDVGLTTLFHRPERGEDGHFLLLISPRADLMRQQEQPRDMVFVIDTSGSMAGTRIQQARTALKFCLRQLGQRDRFAVINFASSVNKWQDKLVRVQGDQVQRATSWVDRLEAVGGTNINDALLAALDMRSDESNRTFTVVFFTDGQPTISEKDPKKILDNVTGRNSSQTRIFTFGVGDDVNTILLDQLAEQTRSVCTYVRESEDIESKVSNLYAKISHPVLTNLKLNVSEGVRISEIYPPQLPDLFHGNQLVVLGRYTGKGKTDITLSGSIEGESKEFTYEVRFPGHTGEDRSFVENLWARRKVGYLLDQIRLKGSNKELVEEVTALAKKHGIPTPYTSYLVVPDNTPLASVNRPIPDRFVSGTTPAGTFTPDLNIPLRSSSFDHSTPPFGGYPGTSAPPANGRIQYAPTYTSPQMQWAVTPGAMGAPPPPNMPVPQLPGVPAGVYPAASVTATTGPSVGVPAPAPVSVPAAEYYQNHGYQIAGGPGLEKMRKRGAIPAPTNRAPTSGEEEEEEETESSPAPHPLPARPPTSITSVGAAGTQAVDLGNVNVNVKETASGSIMFGVGVNSDAGVSGTRAVDLAQALQALRDQRQTGATTTKRANGRTLVSVNGVWLDEGFDAKRVTVKVKAMSKAYFRILEQQPQMREVFQLGTHIVFVLPCGSALVITPSEGVEEMSDEAIAKLFVRRTC